MKKLTYRDNTTNQAVVLPAPGATTTIVMLPAMGVRISYYEPFFEAWQAAGYNVASVDWRGSGNSSERPSHSNNWGFETLVQDLREFRESVEEWFPDTKKILVGHSLGGQLGCLLTARFSSAFDQIIIIACCLVDYSGWEEVGGAWKLRLIGNIFYPISKLLGHFPGTTLGFGGKEAQLVMKDWCHNALSGKYELTDSDFDYEAALKKLNKPFLAINIEDDFFAPVLATKKLYQKFHPNLPVQHLTITKEETGIKNLNHFNWAKYPDYFVGVMKNWITN